MSFFSDRKSLFIIHAQRSKFLLEQLNDSDISDGRADGLLKRLGGSEFKIICDLYAAWCSIAITAKGLIEQGYELSPSWEQDLVSASDQIILFCAPHLSARDNGYFEKNIENIFGNSLRLNPYTSLAPYREVVSNSD